MTDIDKLVKRLKNPPFGTETSERNLMESAAEAIIAQSERLARYEEALREIKDGCAPPTSGCVYCDDAHAEARKALGEDQ